MRIIKKFISRRCKTAAETFDHNSDIISDVLSILNDGILMKCKSGRCGNETWRVEKVNNNFLHLRNALTGDKYDVYLVQADMWSVEARFKKIKDIVDPETTNLLQAVRTKVGRMMKSIKFIKKT
jgi:hypothetical protein